MANFWEKELGREYTVTYHQGEATSEAGQFLEACLFPMDAESIPQLIAQMRKILKNRKNLDLKNTN
jgi:hypothetical protein